MVRSQRNRDTASSVSEVIGNADSTLSALLRHAKSLARAETLLAAYTGPATAAQFQVAAMHQNRLVLLASSATWATRLRMHAKQMLHVLQTSGYSDLLHIDVRVAPLTREPRKNKSRRSLSPAAQLALSLMSRTLSKLDDESNT